MTYESAAALFAVMPEERREAVLRIFSAIKGAFPDVKDAFAHAVADEAYAVETEMLLSQTNNRALQ